MLGGFLDAECAVARKRARPPAALDRAGLAAGVAWQTCGRLG